MQSSPPVQSSDCRLPYLDYNNRIVFISTKNRHQNIKLMVLLLMEALNNIS